MNQSTFSFAILAQNFVGFSSPSFRYSFAVFLFQFAARENPGLGLKVRFSFSRDSISGISSLSLGSRTVVKCVSGDVVGEGGGDGYWTIESESQSESESVNRSCDQSLDVTQASMSSTFFGIWAFKLRTPSFVMTTSSSIRMPMPRKAAGASVSPSSMYKPGSIV